MTNTTQNILTEESILEAPESEYMNDLQLNFFKKRLFKLHEKTLSNIQKIKAEISKTVGVSDPNDLASYQEASIMMLNMLEREQKMLPEISGALKRIKSGEYGYCIDSGESIGIARLLARPTTEYCTEIKKLLEQDNKH